MRKFILPVLLLILGMFVFVGCGSDQSDSPLVGTWGWEFDSEWVYTFRADGTGTRGGGTLQPTLENFTWSERSGGTVVRLDLTSGPVFDNPQYQNRQDWNFTISGNSLTLSNDATGEVYTYIRR